MKPNADRSQLTEAGFDQALQEFRQSGEITPVQSGGMNWQILLLPVSVEQLIRQKDAALPILEHIKTALDPSDRAFADACIGVMTAKHVRRGGSFLSKGNGIEMVAYTISN